jgi:hypothetical protein
VTLRETSHAANVMETTETPKLVMARISSSSNVTSAISFVTVLRSHVHGRAHTDVHVHV